MSVLTGEKAIRTDAVAIYVRWSTEEQGEGTTLQEQSERCKSYVASQGWRVNEDLIFVDDGYSGASLTRPAMAQLRQLIRKGQVDCVVTLKIDRLSRSLVDCVDLVLREWVGVCHFKTVSQPVNTTDELGRMFFAMLAGFAEYERALIRERTFSGLLRRVKEGNFWGAGKAPYGYTRVAKGQLAVNAQEAGIVRLIFQMGAGEGHGSAAIASRSMPGNPRPRGKGWWSHTVRHLLQNRIYIGILEYGKRYVDQRVKTATGKRVLRWREKPLVQPEECIPSLAIVSEAQFERAQRVLEGLSDRHKTRGAGVRSAHLLTGIARCRCGGPLLTGYDRLRRRYYGCQHRDRSRGASGCPVGGGFAYAHQVEPAIAHEIKHRFAPLSRIIESVQRQWHEERKVSAEVTEAYRLTLGALDKRERRLTDDHGRIVRQARRGEITLEEKRSFERDIEAERQELSSQREALELRIRVAETSADGLSDVVTWLRTTDQWDELPADTQKEILRRFVDRVVIYKPKGRYAVPEVDLYWRV